MDKASAAARFSVVIDVMAASAAAGRRAIELDRGGNDARPEGFGQHQPIALLRTGVRPHPIRINLPRYRIAELDFLVLHRVPTQQRGASLSEDLQAATKDGREHCRVAVPRKRRHGQRRQRPPAHGVDVRQRIGRRDPAVRGGVVDNRREEIDGLHQRATFIQPVNPRIVSSAVIDEHAGVGCDRKLAKDVRQLASCELAGTPGTGGVVGQSLHLPFAARLGSVREVFEDALQLVLARELDLESPALALADDSDARSE